MAVNCANCKLLTAILCPIVVLSCWVGLISLFTGQVDSADIYIFLSVPSPLDLLPFIVGSDGEMAANVKKMAMEQTLT